MIISKSPVNIMPEVLKLFRYNEDIHLSEEVMGNFNMLLIAAGFTPEDTNEVDRSLEVLKDMGIVDIFKKEDKYYAKGLIKHGV